MPGSSGCGFTARTIDEADKILKGLAKRFHILDEGWIVTEAGYFDRKAAVIFEDGSIGEVQIWPPGMLDAKHNGGHKDYVLSQQADLDPAARAAAVSRMQDRYSEVAAALDPSFAAKLGLVAPTADSTASISPSGISTVRSSESPSASVSGDPSGGYQAPSNNSAPSLPSAAKSEPSHLNNRIVSPLFEKTDAGDQSLMPDRPSLLILASRKCRGEFKCPLWT